MVRVSYWALLLAVVAEETPETPTAVETAEEATDEPFSRFEFEYSFKGPYIAQTDGQVPFWSYHGHAIAGDENVRLAPSLRSRQGAIWTKKLFDKSGFEIEIVIRISGRGKIGADGMAIWYTTDGAPTQQEHLPIFGSRDKWNGLGIMLDSFDNNSKGDNPVIMVFNNDGSRTYDHNNDGGNEQLATCRRDFRNRPYPVKLKVRYFKGRLDLFYHGGVTEFDDYELCASVESVELPPAGYFGVSAATGGLSDDHDVLKFLTHSLTEKSTEGELSKEEQELREKMEEELKAKEEEFEKEKQKFAEENPEIAAQLDDTQLMDGHNDPQFKAIFDVQNHIQEHIIEILDGIKTATTMLKELPSKLPASSGTGATGETAPSPALSGSDTDKPPLVPPNIATRDHLLDMETMTKSLTSQVAELQTVLRDVQQKTNVLFQKKGETSKNDIQMEAFNKEEEKTERAMMKNSLNHIKQDLQQMVRKQEMLANKGCPPPPEVSCVSSTFFIFATMLQGALIAFIIYYKMSQEAAAKKFF